MGNQKIINKFLSCLRDQRNCSEHTLRAYSRDLEDFSDFLGEERLEKARPLRIRAFLISVRQNGASRKTAARANTGPRVFSQLFQFEPNDQLSAGSKCLSLMH